MANVLENRDERVLNAAVAVAQEEGWLFFTREMVAERAGVATGTINNAYSTMSDLKDAVMQVAVEQEIIGLLAQGMAFGSPIARAAPMELREKALTHLLDNA